MRFKLMKLHVTRYISGKPLQTTENLGLTRDKLPRALGPVLAWIKSGRPEAIRAALTLLSISRCARGGWKEPDLTPITEPSTCRIEIPQSFIQRFLKDHKIIVDPVWVAPHWSTKAGPHGPALWTAIVDWSKLPRQLLTDLIWLGGEPFLDWIESIKAIPRETMESILKYFNPKGRNSSLRKLNIKWDFEGKSRVIAMFDYWSQTVLKPYHDCFMQSLKKLRSDRTFNQTSVDSLFSCPGPYYSFDLRSATDRFPVLLQERILRELIGPDLAAAWTRVLTQWEFTPSWSPSRTVKYGAGQPIGAYSSWAVFALCHHLVVQYAAWRVNKYPFTDYVLLGDDIVIAGSAVGQSYKEVITLLGVSISESKTHVSEDTFEFAKNWFHKGVQITPFPLNGLLEAGRGYVPLAEILRTARRKGLLPARNGHAIDLTDPGFVISLFTALGKAPAFAEKLAYKLCAVLCYPQRMDEVGGKAEAFLRLSGFSVPCTRGLASLRNFFLATAARVKVEIVRDEMERLADLQGKWLGHLYQIIRPVPGSPSQGILTQEALATPVFKVIQNTLENFIAEGMLLPGTPGEEDYQTLLFGSPFRTFPDLSRIDSTRLRRVLLNSQARFVISVIKEFKFLEAEINGNRMNHWKISPVTATKRVTNSLGIGHSGIPRN